MTEYSVLRTDKAIKLQNYKSAKLIAWHKGVEYNTSSYPVTQKGSTTHTIYHTAPN